MEDILKDHRLKEDSKTRDCVFEPFKVGDDIGVSLIQRKCRCGYFSASRVLHSLVKGDFVQRGEKENGVCKLIKNNN